MLARFIVLISLLMLCASEVKANQEKIGWIPTLKQGFEKAKETNKPIFLLSAAPQCLGISGAW